MAPHKRGNKDCRLKRIPHAGQSDRKSVEALDILEDYTSVLCCACSVLQGSSRHFVSSIDRSSVQSPTAIRDCRANT